MRIQINNIHYDLKKIYAKMYDSSSYRYENKPVTKEILAGYNQIYFYFNGREIDIVRENLIKYKYFKLYLDNVVYDLEYRHALHINHVNYSLGFLVSLKHVYTKKDRLLELIMNN